MTSPNYELGRHQEVKVRDGRIIVTEEGIVFSGGRIPILADPVDELRDALDEIERLREALTRIQQAEEMHNRKGEVVGYYPSGMMALHALKGYAND